MAKQINEKRLVGVLASHDSVRKNNGLAKLFGDLFHRDPGLFEKFHFVFTGGTFERIVLGSQRGAGVNTIDPNVLNFMKRRNQITCLPKYVDGGVTNLSYLVVQQKISIVIPFLDQVTTHWLNPENLALNRLCHVWNAKTLMNSGSVLNWFAREAVRDSGRYLQPLPLQLKLVGSGKAAQRGNLQGWPVIECKRDDKDWPRSIEESAIALIAHDEMKARMRAFARQYETTLARFSRILATGDTGRQVMDATRTLAGKICLCRSGPDGGDIEIATEVLYGQCHVVIFFIDPLHPHPHPEDIRTVFAACMIQDKVEMLANEEHARRWMDEIQ